MTDRTVLAGRYIRADEQFLKKRAADGDDVSPFYAAMLHFDTYEDYLGTWGEVPVIRKGAKVSPTDGRDEILYARRNSWIRDAGV